MSNPLFNNFSQMQVNPMLQNLANILQEAKRYQSPQAYLQSLEKDNPQGYQYLMALSQQIKNPMGAAIEALNKQGISPQQLMELLNK
jgi:hypothetical protein